jgi:hypothetical protein
MLHMVARLLFPATAPIPPIALVLGNADLAAANKAAAIERAQVIAPIIEELAGLSAHATARELNRREIPTPTGAPWSAKTVLRVRARLGA